MRIAYVCYWSVFVEDGVSKKITMQAERWRAAGHAVEVFALSPPARGREQQWSAQARTFSSRPGRVTAAARLLADVRRFRPNVVYLRYDLLPPPLHVVTRLAPTVVELNSDDQLEYGFRSRRARLSRLYGAWNWRRLFAHAAAIVSVSGELLSLVERYGRPMHVLGNGIELDGVEPLPATGGGPLRLVFSGTPGQPWHGLDKIVDLAQLLPEIDVSLIGAAPDGPHPPNLTAHGFLGRDAYEPVLAAADAAIGSAGLHRKQLHEASPLKVREYLAYGLPVILPYEDTDLAGVDDWWLLRLPNEESNLVDAADRILAFAREARGRRVPREAVAGRIGAAAKEARRLEILADVARP